MKKSLSLLVAIAMVFSMFAAVASAATASEAGAKLQQLGVIQGDQNGNLMENATWKRQDLAVLLSRLLGVEEEAAEVAKSHTFKDVPAGFYDGYLSWAKAEGYMEGHSATQFGFSETLTNQQFYAVVLRSLGVDTTGDNYANTMALAVEAGIVAEGTNATADAKRGETYVAVVAALDTVVEGTNQTLGEKLGLVVNEKATGIASASATGAKQLTVNFNGVIDTEKAKLEVKRNNATVSGTTVKFADDKKSATIALENKIIEATYAITLSGIDGLDSAKASAEVQGQVEKIAKIEILTASDILPDEDNVLIEFAATNQYGEVSEKKASSFDIRTGDVGYQAVSDTQSFKLTNLGTLKQKNDRVAVTIIDTDSAQQVNKIFTIGEPSLVSKIEVGNLVNTDNKEVASIEAGKSAYLQYSAYDQYGVKVTNLSKLTTSGTGVAIILNDNNLTAGFVASEVGDSNPDLKFTAASTAESKAYNVTFIAVGSGSNVSKTVQVATPKKAATIEFGNFDSALAKGDINKYIPLILKNEKGEALSRDEIVSAANDLTIYAVGGVVTLGSPVIATSGDDKGKIHIATVDNKGNGTIVVQLKNKPEVKAQFSVSVNDNRFADRIAVASKAADQAVVGATTKVKFKSFDQLNGDWKDTGVSNSKVHVKLEKVNGNTNAITSVTGPAGVSLTDGQTSAALAANDVFDQEFTFNAGSVTGTYKLTATLYKWNTATSAFNEVSSAVSQVEVVDGKSSTLTYEVKLDKAVEGNKLFAIKKHPSATVAAYNAADVVANVPVFAKEVKVSAKEGDKTVALPADIIQAISVSHTGVVEATGNKFIAGIAKGATSVSVLFETETGNKSATMNVEVTEDLPQISTITAKKTSKAIAEGAITGKFFWDSALAEELKIVDSYGAEYTSGADITGKYADVLNVRFFISDKKHVSGTGAGDDVTINATTGQLTFTNNAVNLSSFTINAIAANGKTTSIEVSVD